MNKLIISEACGKSDGGRLDCPTGQVSAMRMLSHVKDKQNQ
jgi:hypothetical protein